MEQEEKRWFLGVDWGSAEHWARLADAGGRELGARRFAHSGEGLAQLAQWALAVSGGRADQVWVAIEVPHGPVVESLMERGFRLFSINPKQADRFRDRFSPAGAKDDSRDAEVLSDALRTDARAFRELKSSPAQILELREWSRMGDELGADHTRLTNQLRDQLWRYYPQALELARGAIGQDWFLDLLALAPTPAAAQRLRRDALARLIKRHRLRRIEAAGALATLRAAAIRLAPGAAEAASAHVGLIIPRLRLINRQLRQVRSRLDQITQAIAQEGQASGQSPGQRDVTVLRSLPGVGRTVIATLLAEAWEPLQRRDYHALRCLAGVAPVTRRSGKTVLVIRRRAANQRLANALYHWARVAAQRDGVSKAKYAALRSRGCSHARALRGLGDRLLAIACAMLESQTTFDPNQAHGTPRAA
ncbi:MAG TPA: IS110 family transposase [Caulobacteraceae bacterium]|jgi:transposase|nr:IS110 family transposase [Caulobacteraceae bacterium]